ncbi:MAG: sugar nucleotide-binding protein [bacterium]|nr:sugar nucleotide-binding protein [bacterium]
MRILIIGSGYVGTRCAQSWADAVVADGRINSESDAINILEKYQPDAVLNAAAITGKPNVDWCETHQFETIQGNVTLPVNIAKACAVKKTYLLHIGTGCIFYGKAPDGIGWKEEDFANPESMYSKSKYAADLLLSTLENIGIARIRLPADSIPSEKNLINRFAKYKTILDVENSITVIEDMVRIFRQLLELKGQGIFHCTQKGSILYRDFIDLYRKYVDPTAEKEFITEEELLKRGLALKNRATNVLQSFNLEKLGLEMRPTKEILTETLQKYAAASGQY